MKMIGFSAEDEKSVFKVVAGEFHSFFSGSLVPQLTKISIAATIHLGNVKFQGKGDSCDVAQGEGGSFLSFILEL